MTAAPQVFGVLNTEILAGQVITGGILSTTVTVNAQIAVLPAASVAVAITVVVPIGNVLPETGLKLTVAPGQLSSTWAV